MSTPLSNLNKRLLIALGLSSDSAQIVIDHVAELTDEAGRLRTEIVCLKQDLKDAGMGRCTCSDCGKVVGNAWRDSDGHHCLTCVANERDRFRTELTRHLVSNPILEGQLALITKINGGFPK